MNSEHDESELFPAPTPSGTFGEASAPVDFASRARCPFPIVGVGASAGGIEALKAFFTASTADSGMAYIVIQHLSPEHHSLMADILGRCTSMPVSQIEDGVRIEPNRVYVIRPGYTVTLKNARLHLGEPVEKRGHRRPIDDFFRSLAQEQQEKAIAVILSGTGLMAVPGRRPSRPQADYALRRTPTLPSFRACRKA
jgi:two-component system CheB/CheR fusion protein